SNDAAFQTNNTTDTTAPTISITAPGNGATVSGSITVSGTATDNVGVSSVQFLLDGNNLGSSVSAAPYQVNWDTSTASNASHTLSAKAFDAAGNVGNAVGISVTVSNTGSGGAGAAAQDFQNRCSAPGVIVCDNLSSSAGMPQRSCSGSGSVLSGLFVN